ncbi:hypothetical protein GCM10022419_063450 [Nonomuraea rosea]|uniref:Uncharacterized protein n=1 Tax=Nonomuraea rosea TaxID=638574 RepID=A0ABP6XYM8_9ACTN
MADLGFPRRDRLMGGGSHFRHGRLPLEAALARESGASYARKALQL